MNHNITYERNANKSFMKIPAVKEPCLDEKIMLHKEYRGILQVEKCYINGEGQYWYNITGKQTLDTYCKINGVDTSFFKQLMLRICSQLEILEWNLIDSGCLVLNPDYIFMNYNGEEISFILYPDSGGDFWEELQKLMEYLLPKLNHEEQEGVKQAYRIYEMLLSKAFSIEEITQEIVSENEVLPIVEPEEMISEKDLQVEENTMSEIEQKISNWLEKIRSIVWNNQKTKDAIPSVVYPEDVIEEKVEIGINPTICLTADFQQANGKLLYEGRGDYPDFQLDKGTGILGKNPKATLHLDKDTISQFHAKFDYVEEHYYIEDMNSTNGTYVNDESLNYKEKRKLSSGDLIRFADVKYRFL